MTSLISRAAFAAVLATTLSAGFVALSPTAARAQISPADPNYDYETRGKTTPWNSPGAHAQAPDNYSRQDDGASSRASAAGAKHGRDRGRNGMMRR